MLAYECKSIKVIINYIWNMKYASTKYAQNSCRFPPSIEIWDLRKMKNIGKEIQLISKDLSESQSTKGSESAMERVAMFSFQRICFTKQMDIISFLPYIIRKDGNALGCLGILGVDRRAFLDSEQT